MSRNKIMTLAQRRERAARKHAARVRYAQISSGIDVRRKGLLVTSLDRAKAGDATVAPQYWHKLPAKVRAQAEEQETAAVKPVEVGHVTRVTPLADKYVASCECGEWTSKPMGEGHAKGAATRHRNAAAAVAAA
jgi:hypothetical protein